MNTPQLHLQTCFVLDADGRIASTREPNGDRGPLFSLVRGLSSCAWAVRKDVPAELAHELDQLARDEPPAVDFHDPPMHAQRYLDALAGRVRPAQGISRGVAFSFPDVTAVSDDVIVVASEALLERNFRGWLPGEIAAGRGPVLAIFDGGFPVSVCFCARRSDSAAEAGLETAEPYRRRGFGARVTAAWSVAIRSAGRVPLYSTSWSNEASLGVARKLSLVSYASSWSVVD
ncbi:MAG TPA: GNAT family N-acetyltransferase [Polyangiales bacterium]|nr:GNAT family N-acetyltransferase [Polyangiales bacterium]